MCSINYRDPSRFGKAKSDGKKIKRDLEAIEDLLLKLDSTSRSNTTLLRIINRHFKDDVDLSEAFLSPDYESYATASVLKAIDHILDVLPPQIESLTSHRARAEPHRLKQRKADIDSSVSSAADDLSLVLDEYYTAAPHLHVARCYDCKNALFSSVELCELHVRKNHGPKLFPLDPNHR